jgi:hypothetical protein
MLTIMVMTIYKKNLKNDSDSYFIVAIYFSKVQKINITTFSSSQFVGETNFVLIQKMIDLKSNLTTARSCFSFKIVSDEERYISK